MRDRETFLRLQALRALREADSPAYNAAEYERLRDELIVRHLGLAHHLAVKFADRGEPVPDLVQVAALGLINAIDRYDPQRGVEFSTYATPTILGEVKRYFRDRGWALKAPRRLRELNMAMGKAADEFAMAHGRAPTIDEIAAKLKSTPEELLQARELGVASSMVSLDEPGHESGRSTVSDSVGEVESELESLVERLTIERALSTLSGRERVIVSLRFFEGASQSDIAGRLGVSQMQISRLQHKALAKLRAVIEDDAGRGGASS
jgi:RNA polymerase sigma-B factor